MDRNYKIPTVVQSFPEGTDPAPTTVEFDTLTYEPTKGELINVVYWVRFPSYDFIFGIPDETNPRYKKEVGFYQFRDTRTKTVPLGFYCDVLECLGLIKGFSEIKRFGSEKHPLWKNVMIVK
jgi:hypothetical protein